MLSKITLAKQLADLINSDIACPEGVKSGFRQRLAKGHLTRSQNPLTHFSCFFAALDLGQKQVYLGHHKKTDLWIFNGGHLEEGETLEECVRREINEEWGLKMKKINQPQFLTITEANNPAKYVCQRHFDLWHFIFVNKNLFAPKRELEAKEFYEMRWVGIPEARSLILPGASSAQALDFIENVLFSPA